MVREICATIWVLLTVLAVCASWAAGQRCHHCSGCDGHGDGDAWTTSSFTACAQGTDYDTRSRTTRYWSCGCCHGTADNWPIPYADCSNPRDGSEPSCWGCPCGGGGLCSNGPTCEKNNWQTTRTTEYFCPESGCTEPCVPNSPAGCLVTCCDCTSGACCDGCDYTPVGSQPLGIDDGWECSGTTAQDRDYWCTGSGETETYTVTDSEDCCDAEVLATDDDGNEAASIDDCTGGVGRSCSLGACESLDQPDETDSCVGTCGLGENSCRFREYYPDDSPDGCPGDDYCAYQDYDADGSGFLCGTCLGAGRWAVGGEVAQAECCGDDDGEYYRDNFNEACCDEPDDFVYMNQQCVPAADRANVTGTVTGEQPDGGFSPLQGAYVRVMTQDMELVNYAITDALGHYDIPAVKGSSYYVVVLAEKHDSPTEPLDPVSDTELNFTLSLSTDCRPDCTVFDGTDFRCEAGCDGTNGCSYDPLVVSERYAASMREMCDDKLPGWTVEHNATHNIACCNQGYQETGRQVVAHVDYTPGVENAQTFYAGTLTYAPEGRLYSLYIVAYDVK